MIEFRVQAAVQLVYAGSLTKRRVRTAAWDESEIWLRRQSEELRVSAGNRTRVPTGSVGLTRYVISIQ